MKKNNFIQAVKNKDLPLTPRQIEVLQLRANGLSYGQIAVEMGVGYQAVKNYAYGLLIRLNLPDNRRNITAAIYEAYSQGVII